MTSLPGPLDLLGQPIGLAIAAVSRVRPSEKPMHPRGEVAVATLRRLGTAGGPGTGAGFLDEPGTDQALVRVSRSIGLPTPYPDVDGLAVRVPTSDGGHADLLLAGTGRGRLVRHLLLPSTHGRGWGRFVSSLVPYRAPCGPVQLGAEATGDGAWDLVWASPLGGWTRFATLRLTDEPGPDASISFDAVLAGPDGLAPYDWHRRLRGPSYRAARRARGLRD